ncbi:MAG: hypothetical protein ACK4GT_00215 [Pararhodobacter sp.]
MSGASVTIVTTRPDRALVKLFGEARAPEGVRVVSSIQAVGEIASGSRCIAVWFEPRKYCSALEWAWIMRRERGGIVGLDMAEVKALLNASRSGGQATTPDARSGLRPVAGGMPPVTSLRERRQDARPC